VLTKRAACAPHTNHASLARSRDTHTHTHTTQRETERERELKSRGHHHRHHQCGTYVLLPPLDLIVAPPFGGAGLSRLTPTFSRGRLRAELARSITAAEPRCMRETAATLTAEPPEIAVPHTVKTLDEFRTLIWQIQNYHGRIVTLHYSM
jgi:hypothetical protein